jgi:hypothetical protein
VIREEERRADLNIRLGRIQRRGSERPKTFAGQ